ncbi:MAG TPA: OmpA family protein [Candidatus Angelobacter sp.]|nr:OmpA family protein [Candidatus Angelobacter sp.]
MRKTGLILLAIAGILLPKLGHTQQAQPASAAQPRSATGGAQVGNTPTPNDMYCSGFLSTEKIPDKMYVAAGHNSPDQTRYAGASDVIFIHGSGMKEGDRYQIVRHVKDLNHYELFSGQRSAVKQVGEPYLELGIVRITGVQKETGIAAFELSCADVIPGDLAVPLVERTPPPFRNVVLDHYTPPSGKPQGRILMAKEFDSFLGTKHKVYLSIGEDKGLKPGDYLRATRTYSYTYHDPEAGLSLKATPVDDIQANAQKLTAAAVSSLPRRTVGDMIVLEVHRKSATAMILTALEDIHVGDGVEVMDVSDAAVLAPISPAFSNAPDAGAANAANATPPRITCSSSPASLRAGESATITCDAVSPDNRPLNITFVANGGKLSSNKNQATLDTTDAPPGPIAVRATAFDDRQLSASTVTSVSVEAPAPALPTAQKLMELDYKTGSAYVDNRSKAVLDDVALKLQQDPNLNVVLSGSAQTGEGSGMALRRAQNAMVYLTKSKGIDPQRIQVKAATEPGNKVEVWTVPAGAAAPGTTPPGAAPQNNAPQDQPAAQPPADQPAAQPAEQPAATPQPTPPPQ